MATHLQVESSAKVPRVHWVVQVAVLLSAQVYCGQAKTQKLVELSAKVNLVLLLRTAPKKHCGWQSLVSLSP
jgi:hypothetical protein